MNKQSVVNNMAQQDNSALNTASEESTVTNLAMVEELANAKKEIQELRMQIMWMERNYE